jgi:hypothetical protein
MMGLENYHFVIYRYCQDWYLAFKAVAPGESLALNVTVGIGTTPHEAIAKLCQRLHELTPRVRGGEG